MSNEELQEAINKLLELSKIYEESFANNFLHALLAEQVRRATGGAINYVPYSINLY